MGGIDLPYLWAVTVRKRGRRYVYHYYRRSNFRERVSGEPGSVEWFASYQAIHERYERRPPDRPVARSGSLADLVAHYKAAPEFKQLSPKSRRDYERYLGRLVDEFGDLSVKTLPAAFVFELRDRYADTPRTANYVVAVLRRLLNFAVDREWRRDNPALGRKFALRTGGGHRPWTDAEIAAFRTTWPADTVERVAFELLLNTGQRGGDVVAMDRRQYRGGAIHLVQSKTGVRLEIPASAALRAVLDPWLASHEHVVMLSTRSGRPFKVDHFRHTMRAAYREAALPADVTTHGLRYTAATVLRELGTDLEDIAAITGHRTLDMVRQYTRQRRTAEAAIARLDDARRERGANSEP